MNPTPERTRAASARQMPSARPMAADEARRRLLAAMPVAERRLQLAGIETAIVEGGSGPPLVLLHGPAAYAAHWLWVIPRLVSTHRVIAPDLPGHGASTAGPVPLDVESMLAWLAALIERTCKSRPVLVGQTSGGAIAARFAARYGANLERLVLVDSLGLREFQPQPEFGRALAQYMGQPDLQSLRTLWSYCAYDADALRERAGAIWEAFEAYNLDRACAPQTRAALSMLMQQFAGAEIPAAELARIRVPTALIWGRHDLATPLAVAEAASRRYGWPLQVIEAAADDPPVERPEEFVQALRAALEHEPRPA